MNQIVKEKWTTSLRSGQYKQGKNVLRDEYNNFCCLGVLCDLHAKETGAEWEKWCGEFMYGERKQMISPDVADWAGIPYLKVQGEVVIWTQDNTGMNPAQLAEINDSGVSFSAIADVIENQL